MITIVHPSGGRLYGNSLVYSSSFWQDPSSVEFAGQTIPPDHGVMVQDESQAYWFDHRLGRLVPLEDVVDLVLVRRWMAQRDDAPPELLENLSKDEDEDVRRNVAKNISTPPLALDALAYEFSEKVAWNRSARASTLARLHEHPETIVRLGVAYNHATPPRVMIEMANKDDLLWTVARAIASNPNAPPEALAKLALWLNGKVRLEVAKHQNTPIEALRTLAKDEFDGDVADEAKENLARRGLDVDPSES